MSSKTYNLQAGLLMTILIGAAFVIHRDQEALYLAGGSASGAVEHQTGRSGGYPESAVSTAAAAGSTEGKLSTGLSARSTPHAPQ